MKCVESLRREKVKSHFGEILKEDKISLSLALIEIKEDVSQEKTEVNFKFCENISSRDNEYLYSNELGNGFVDCIFNICMRHYRPQYRSLENLRLLNLRVAPDFLSTKKKSQSDAFARVLLDMEIKRYGTSIFEFKSPSIVRSASMALLSAFEFYINCEKTFHALQTIFSDAKDRNRNDIAARCKLRMSDLTEMNSYNF